MYNIASIIKITALLIYWFILCFLAVDENCLQNIECFRLIGLIKTDIKMLLYLLWHWLFLTVNILFQDLVTVPENDVGKKVEDMDLHRVEALLYTFHKLGKQCPDYLSKDPERQKEFKKKYCISN